MAHPMIIDEIQNAPSHVVAERLCLAAIDGAILAFALDKNNGYQCIKSIAQYRGACMTRIERDIITVIID